MEKIVVGIDGSEPAQRGLEWAVAEASVRGASLVVVHAWQPSAAVKLEGTVPPPPAFDWPGPLDLEIPAGSTTVVWTLPSLAAPLIRRPGGGVDDRAVGPPAQGVHQLDQLTGGGERVVRVDAAVGVAAGIRRRLHPWRPARHSPAASRRQKFAVCPRSRCR